MPDEIPETLRLRGRTRHLQRAFIPAGLALLVWVTTLIPDPAWDRPVLLGIAAAGVAALLLGIRGPARGIDADALGVVVTNMVRRRQIAWAELDDIDFDVVHNQGGGTSYHRLAFLTARGVVVAEAPGGSPAAGSPLDVARTRLLEMRDAFRALDAEAPPPAPPPGAGRPRSVELYRLLHPGGVTSLTITALPGGAAALASAGGDGTIWVWDLATGRRVRDPLRGHAQEVTGVAATRGSRGQPLLVSSGRDGTGRVWDVEGEATGAVVRTSSSPLSAVAAGSSDGRPLAAFGGDDAIVWDVAAGATASGAIACGAVRALAMTSGTAGTDAMLAVGGNDGSVRLWDPTAARPVGAPVVLHSGPVTALTFVAAADGGTLLVSAGGDGRVQLRSVARRDPAGTLLTTWMLPPPVLAVAARTDEGGRLLLAASGGDRLVRLWDVRAGVELGGPHRGHRTLVTTLEFGATSDGTPVLVSAGTDGSIIVRDLARMTR